MVDNVDKTPKTRMNTHFFLTTSVAQVCSRLKEVFVDKKMPPVLEHRERFDRLAYLMEVQHRATRLYCTTIGQACQSVP